MDNLIADYLRRLEVRLTKRWSPDEVEGSVRELSAHLSESVATLMATGLDRNLASAEALRRLGSEKLLAENLIRARSGVDTRSVWRIGWLPAALLFGTATLPDLLEILPPANFEKMLLLIGLVSNAFLVALCVVAWRSRRLLWKPMGAALGASVIVGLAYTFLLGPAGVSGFSASVREKNLAGFDRYLSEIEVNRSKAKVALSGGEIPKFDGTGQLQAPVQSVAISKSSVGFLPISWETDRTPTVYLAPASSDSEARKLWALHGAAYLKKLEAEEAEQTSLRETWAHMRVSPELVAAAALRITTYSAAILAFLLLLNSLVLALVWTRRKVIENLWRPARE